MNFLKRLLGGGRGASDPDGLYFYFRADQSDEVIRVRLHRYNDLSLSDDGNQYFAHKGIVGPETLARLEADFVFDKKRRLLSCDVQGGKMVTRADYDAYRAQHHA